MIEQAALERAFREACAEELEAPKPGNVGAHAAGHGMTTDDFSRSAAAAAPHVCAAGASLGTRICRAVSATREVAGQNTNLGIVLLCAPLAKAAETADCDLRSALVRVLEGSDLADAEAVFRAIALAAPGGLGQASRHDVRAPATVTLAVAMAEAAGRDSIARQWVGGFVDVFERGVPAYRAARARWPDPKFAALAPYLRFLAAFPDSHIARKYGLATAEHVRAEAVGYDRRLQETADPASLLPDLLAWDAALKQGGLNPGTSADLTVASLFAAKLLDLLRYGGNDG